MSEQKLPKIIVNDRVTLYRDPNNAEHYSQTPFEAAAQPASRSGGEPPICCGVPMKKFECCPKHGEFWHCGTCDVHKPATPAPDAAGERPKCSHPAGCSMPNLCRVQADCQYKLSTKHDASQPPEKVAPALSYMQAFGGLCFAHGEYKGNQCPKWPACATDPQVFKPTPPPEKVGAAQKLMVNQSGEIHEASPDCRGVCSEYKPTPPPQGPLEITVSHGGTPMPSGAAWVREGHPVEGKARPSCPKCGSGSFDVRTADVYNHNEFYQGPKVYETLATCWSLACEYEAPLSEFFRPTLPGAEELEKVLIHAKAVIVRWHPSAGLDLAIGPVERALAALRSLVETPEQKER